MTRKLTQNVERLLADVPEQYVFKCGDGRILRNERDLRDALLTITNETFAYHSNNVKHDFSVWVRDVVKDRRLARDLARSTSRIQAAKRVAHRVSFLSSKIGPSISHIGDPPSSEVRWSGL